MTTPCIQGTVIIRRTTDGCHCFDVCRNTIRIRYDPLLAFKSLYQYTLLYGNRTVNSIYCVHTLHTVYGVRCTVYGVRRTVYGVRCTVYGVRFTAVGVRCTVYGVRCTVYLVWWSV